MVQSPPWLAGHEDGDVPGLGMRVVIYLVASNDLVGNVLGMRVWIDQDLCTGDGLCVDHCPEVFTQLEDGIAYVVENGVTLNDPGSGGSLAKVPTKHLEAVVLAANFCPGECIFIDISDDGGNLDSVNITMINV